VPTWPSTTTKGFLHASATDTTDPTDDRGDRRDRAVTDRLRQRRQRRGGGGSGGGSTEAFCDEIQTLAESTGETTEEEDLAALQKVADVAPDEIADEMNELLDGFEQLQAFDPEAASEEEMGDFLAIADGLDEASTAIEEFALDNCPDIPADLFETE
jgi:hypothetical protein